MRDYFDDFLSWDGYVRKMDELKLEDFVDIINKYRQVRPSGDRHHFRVADRIAKSCSPMMLYGVPVGRMFFEGAPRLLKSGVSILPCHKNAGRRIVVEAYPKLVAKKLIQKLQYKSDNKKKRTPLLEDARRKIMKKLNSDCIRLSYLLDKISIFF